MEICWSLSENVVHATLFHTDTIHLIESIVNLYQILFFEKKKYCYLLQYINTNAAIFLFTFFMAYVFTTLGYHTTYEIQNRSRSLNLQSQKFKFQTSIIDNGSQSHWLHTNHLPTFPQLLTTALLTSSIRIAIFQRTKTFYHLTCTMMKFVANFGLIAVPMPNQFKKNFS